MTHKTQSELVEVRQTLGLRSAQLSALFGLAKPTAWHDMEIGRAKCGAATAMLIDIVTGKIDPDNPEHDEAYEEALSKLGLPTQLLIKVITGEAAKEKMIASVPHLPRD